MLSPPFAPLPGGEEIYEAIYAINGGNFTQIEYYLSLPIEEFELLVKIHNKACKKLEEKYKR